MKNKIILLISVFLIANTVWAQEVMMKFITAENVSLSFSLYASSADTPIEVDWGDGKEVKNVNQIATSISGTSSGTVTVYGDASLIVRAAFNNVNFREIDLSKASGLATVSFSTSSNSNLTSLILPDNPDNLKSLDVSYSKLTELDLSSYLNLNTLIINNTNALNSLILPGKENQLSEFTANSTVVSRIDLSNCTNLTKITSYYSSNLEEFILPDQADKLTTITLVDSNLSGTFDLSYLSNLLTVNCTFNKLTGVIPPSEPRNGLDMDIYNNRILLPDLPEGPFFCSYTPQYAEYTLSDEYTTLDWIDLSEWYVGKRGIRYQYESGEVYYPTFTWYVDGSTTALVEGTDYEVVDNCKFRFSQVPSGPVYCVIYSDAYPELKGQERIKTTNTTIQKGVEYDELFSLITTENVSVSFSLYASAVNTPIQVDWGNGRELKSIGESATSISGTSGGLVTVYGDASSIVRAAFNNINFREIDLSKASGLTTVSFFPSSSSNLTSLILPDDPENLKSLDVSYSKLTELDLSSYLNLTTLNINNTTALSSLLLPGEGNQLNSFTANSSGIDEIDLSDSMNLTTLSINNTSSLNLLTLPGKGNKLSEFTANYTGINRIDLSDCSNLTKITSNGCSNMEEFILPLEADNLTNLNLVQSNLTGVLDLSRFGNLLSVDCTFNQLTKVLLPSDPRAGLDVDIYNNRILLPDLPEGPFFCSYTPQYAEYTLSDEYTTLDWIDLSEWYVGKRGIRYQYESGEVYYPTFTWYVDGSTTALVEGTDYEVVDNCKFRFSQVPSGPVYCVIYSDAYPELKGQERIKTTNTTIQKGVEYDELMKFSLSSVGGQISIKLYGSENDTPVQIDWGNGRKMYTVSATGNTLRDNSVAETVTVYANSASIVKAEISGNTIHVADFSRAVDLNSLKCNTSSRATSVILPEEKVNLESLDLEYNNLSELNLSEYTNLEEISCKGNAQLATLVLPTETGKLRVLNCLYIKELTRLDVSPYSNLEKLSLQSSEKLEKFTLPEGTALKELICVEIGLTGVLDMSKYVNLTVLDCSYNQLTAILLPEEPSSQLDLTCYYNNMYLHELPEGPFSLYYTPQNVEYSLDFSYTTNELIDLSEWYVRKKGAGYYYNQNGSYPVFQWYLSDSNTPLVAGSDYSVIDGCKFRFSRVPEGNVYCVISHSGYPEFNYDQALTTNDITIIYEEESSELLVTMVSQSTEKIEFVIASMQGNTNVEVELNGNKVSYSVEEEGTAITLNTGGEIKIYGNPERINYLDVSGIQLTSLDASTCDNLEELNCNNNDLETLILPTGNMLKRVNCENNNLSTLDVTENNLSSLKLKNNQFTLATLPYSWTDGTYAPQADYVITPEHVSEATIDLSELYVSKVGVKSADVTEEVFPEFIWYVVGESTPLEAEKDYTIEDGSKFEFIFEGAKEIYAVISTEAYPDFTGENAYKSTSYTITPSTGVSSLENEMIHVFAHNNNIVIIASEECEYTIVSISGSIIARGDVYESVNFPVYESGVYIVHIKTEIGIETYKVLVSTER